MNTDCWSAEDLAEIRLKVGNYLWLYLQPSASIEELTSSVQNLTNLSKTDIEYLSIVHYLLSDEVKNFILSSPKLIRRFSHSTQKEKIVYRGLVKGAIDWNLTVKERSTKGLDWTLFVCKPTSRIYNLPENQLFKFLLIQIKRLIEELQVLPSNEVETLSLDQLKTEDGKETLKERLAWLRQNINNVLKSVLLDGVDLPGFVSERMVIRAQTARNKDYEVVATAYLLFYGLLEKMDRQLLERLLKTRILEPLEKDRLYELYVLFEIMAALGKPFEINLIKSGAEAIATYKLDTTDVKVFYQKASGLLENSVYKNVFDNYELDVSLRRPDIVLQIKTEKESKLLIVEVKRSINDDYIVDSVYKVLGYLADFKTQFPNEGQKPKALLVVWSIKRKNPNIPLAPQEIIILGASEIRDYVKELLS